MAIRTIAVTGSTGFVGRHVVAELVKRGHHVKALARDRAKAKEQLPPAAEVVVGDILDDARLRDLVRACDAVVHLVGIIREAPNGQTFRRMHTEATRAVVRACEAVPVKRFLHMSALGVSDLGPAEYQRTKFEAERIVRDSSLDWTIFRPGLIHGPGSEFIDMMEGLASGLDAPFIFIPYFTRSEEDQRVPLGGDTVIDPVAQPVWVEDVAHAFALALDNPQSVGEIYNLVGAEHMPLPILLKKIRDGTHGNHLLQPWGVPSKLAAFGAMAAKRVGLGRLLPFDEGMALMGAQDTTADREKVRRHLGIETRGFTETFATYAESI